jgi:hypothetical protein
MACELSTNLFEALDNFVSCPHCQQSYKEPRKLPCSHIYCATCLTQIMDTPEQNEEFCCPLCQMEIPVPTNGVQEFPDEPALVNFIKALDMIKSLRLNQSPKCSLCAVAEPTVNAQSLCVDCMNTFCELCEHKHKYLLPNHSTPLLPCQDMQLYHMETIMKNRITTCSEHGKTLKVFCDSCKVMICQDCGNFEHNGHIKQHAASVGDTMRTGLSEYVQKLHKREDEYDAHSIKNDIAKTEYIQQATSTKAQLKEHGDKVIEQIKQFIEGTNEAIGAETAKILDKIDALKETLRLEKSRLSNLATYISSMVIYGNQDDVTTLSHNTEFYDTLLREHQATHTIPALDVDLQLIDLDQLNVNNTIGMLEFIMRPGNLNSHLVKIFHTGFNPSGVAAVACTEDDNILACEFDGSRAAMFKPDGSRMVTFQMPEDTMASGVACTQEHVYITDFKTKAVLVFDYRGQHIKSIPVKINLYGFVALCGANMYVTSQGDNKVYKLKLPDGDNKIVFLPQSEWVDLPWNVAANSTRVAVSSDEKHTVHVFDSAGKLKFIYGECGNGGAGPGQLNSPQAVALDPVGRVIIADYANNRICILSSNGKHLWDIMLEPDNPSTPRALCINNNGDIVVGCSTSHTIATYKYSFEY